MYVDPIHFVNFFTYLVDFLASLVSPTVFILIVFAIIIAIISVDN